MFNQLNDELLRTKESLEEKRKLVRNLETVQYDITVKKNTLEDFKKNMYKEKKDVEKLILQLK